MLFYTYFYSRFFTLCFKESRRDNKRRCKEAQEREEEVIEDRRRTREYNVRDDPKNPFDEEQMDAYIFFIFLGLQFIISIIN